MIVLDPSPEEAAVLDKEIARIRGAYGVTISRQQVIRALIEMHKVRLQTVAKESPKSTIGWLWSRTWLDDE